MPESIELRRARLRLRFLEQRCDRLKNLIGSGACSDEEYEEVKYNVEDQRLVVEGLEGKASV